MLAAAVQVTADSREGAMPGASSLTAALFAALALVAGCGAGGAGTTTDGEALCSAPVTSVAEPTVSPGQTVRVSAVDLWSSCRDHGIADDDGNVSYPDPEPSPLTGLHVRWTQDDTVVDLGTVDADSTAAAELDVTIPADADAGPAELTVGPHSSPAAVTVVTEAASPRTSP
jgi:hypothetical protein